MQQVLSGFNSTTGPDFVSVYLDDVIVGSHSIEVQVDHLRAVVQRLVEVGLKLKPTKVQYAREKLEYLEHIVS